MKYMGSKRRIKKELAKTMSASTSNIKYYIEPFCGGLNSLTVEMITDKKVICNDANPFLIALWKGLQGNLPTITDIPKDLYTFYKSKWRKLNEVHTEGHLIDIVNNYNIDSSEFNTIFNIGWVGYMASFNGKFYDGVYSGKAAGRDYVDEQIRNTMSQKPIIENISFSTNSYDKVNIADNSIVYCDIPYRDTTQYAYSKGFDYEKFYGWCKDITANGNNVNVFVSEYSMPSEFTSIWEKQVTNSLGTTNTYRPVEKLFTIKK